jgi:hypothetical protein
MPSHEHRFSSIPEDERLDPMARFIAEDDHRLPGYSNAQRDLNLSPTGSFGYSAYPSANESGMRNEHRPSNQRYYPPSLDLSIRTDPRDLRPRRKVRGPSSSVASTQPSDLFSQVSSRSSISSGSPTDAHSHYDLDSLTQEILRRPPPGPMPCTFSFTGCVQVFPLDELDTWYSHSLSHFEGNPPPKYSICIFCDREFSSSDPLKSWRAREHHIAGHYSRRDARGERPDFRLIKHMYANGLLEEIAYQHMVNHKTFNMVDGLKDLDWVPSERDRGDEPVAIAVNLRQERRVRERSERERKMRRGR